MAKVLYLAVEKLRQYRLIASQISEALLHLVCEFGTPNNAFEPTVVQHGPRLAAAHAAWPAAQLNR